MKDIKSFDTMDWAMVALMTTLLSLAVWWAYLFENTGIVSGVGIGVPIGALAIVLAMSAREPKEAAERKGQV